MKNPLINCNGAPDLAANYRSRHTLVIDFLRDNALIDVLSGESAGCFSAIVSCVESSPLVKRCYLANRIAEALGASRLSRGMYAIEIPACWIVYNSDDEQDEKPYLMFFPTVDSFVRNRPTVSKIGKAIQTIFPGIYSSREIEIAAARIVADNTRASYRLEIYDETPDIVNMYESFRDTALASCLSYAQYDFETPYNEEYHPCEAYGGPQSTIRLAVLFDDDEEPVARALVCVETMQFARIYCGDNPTFDRLMKAELEKAGFQTGSMTGAKIRAIPFEYDSEGWFCSAGHVAIVMPYFDGFEYGYLSLDSRHVVVGREPNGKHVCLRNHPEHATNFPAPRVCEGCGKRTHETLRRVTSSLRVGERHYEKTRICVCDECYRESRSCEHCGAHVSPAQWERNAPCKTCATPVNADPFRHHQHKPFERGTVSPASVADAANAAVSESPALFVVANLDALILDVFAPARGECESVTE